MVFEIERQQFIELFLEWIPMLIVMLYNYSVQQRFKRERTHASVFHMYNTFFFMSRSY
jgi:hypothetical protein